MDKNRINNDLRKNKPNIVFPIISMVISLFCIGAIIMFKVNGAIRTSYFIIFLIVLILYPIGSWYTNYFSKKKNTKKLHNYEKEFELITQYAKRYEGYFAVETDNEKKLLINFTKRTDNNLKNYSYDLENCSFGKPDTNKMLIMFGVTFMGLEVDLATNQLGDLVGIIPSSIWYKRKLKNPEAIPATAHAEYEGINPSKKIVIQVLRRSDIFYDKKSGWLLIGERKTTPLDDHLLLAENVILTIREGIIMGLWIKIAANLDV